MKRRSKFISGQKEPKLIVKKPNQFFSLEQRHKIVKELLNSGCTKREIWEKYTGQEEEHGQLLRWMRELGYESSDTNRRNNNSEINNLMSKKKRTTKQESLENFEQLQLKKRIFELENQLKEAEMKAIAFSTMVDIAEKEFNISIRKKFNTKPLKK
jgi:transposase